MSTLCSKRPNSSTSFSTPPTKTLTVPNLPQISILSWPTSTTKRFKNRSNSLPADPIPSVNSYKPIQCFGQCSPSCSPPPSSIPPRHAPFRTSSFSSTSRTTPSSPSQRAGSPLVIYHQPRASSQGIQRVSLRQVAPAVDAEEIPVQDLVSSQVDQLLLLTSSGFKRVAACN